MGVLRQLFGPSQEEIWRQFAEQLGAAYVKGGWRHVDKVVARFGQWTVALDTYTVSTGDSSTTYTRMRAPYVNRDGFRFTIYGKGFFSQIGKLFGMQDIEIGVSDFDEAFIIKGNDESKVRALFSERHIRDLLMAQPAVHLTVKDDEGWFGADFPEGVDELYFSASGVIKEIARLRGLYELFGETLHKLCHIGSAYEDDPNIIL